MHHVALSPIKRVTRSTPSHANRVAVGASTCQLERVSGRGGGVGAARWCPPFQDAWFRLLEPPPFGLFTAVVVSAERGEVTGTCRATVVPGAGVVQVAAGGGPPAAG